MIVVVRTDLADEAVREADPFRAAKKLLRALPLGVQRIDHSTTASSALTSTWSALQVARVRSATLAANTLKPSAPATGR